MLKKLKNKLRESKTAQSLRQLLYSIHLPGFAGMPLLHVLEFFFHGVQKSSLTNRAAAVSFKFFMALFPGIIFLISIIPYVPVKNFHQQLLVTIEGIIPSEVYPMIEKTVVDVVKNRQTGLLSLGFLIAFFFSTNGMNGLMKAFNESAFITETRKPFKQRLVALMLTMIAVLGLLIVVSYLVYINRFIYKAYRHDEFSSTWLNILLTLKWAPVFCFLYFLMASIFFFAPSKSMRSRFLSTGALTSTLFSILFTYLVSIYINNFNSYNKIYGVVGAFPVILIFIFLNSISLLIGFELNVSIRHAQRLRQK